ncbi:CPBP family intramembrane glutamic endopeptidase [Aliiruegeria haliotis]|nr:CPBP family intramembrane glutamic endopeptidase [Aliiruegeria haliotis]
MSTVWPEILTWLPLTIALAIGWAGHRILALPFLAMTACLGWWFGFLSPISILLFSVCLGIAAWLPRLPKGFVPLKHILLILLCFIFGLEMISGVERMPIAIDVQTGPASVPFSYSIGLEKPFAFFVLLFALPELLLTPTRADKRFVAAGLLLLGGLFALAVLTQTVRWEPSIPEWLPVFIVGNLLLTCLPEEAFFRGYLQRELAARLGIWTAIVVTSALFGLAHLSGGIVLVVFATVAGLAYGLAYQLGGGLRSAVFFHFGFNIVHLTLFTYPAAAG